MRAGQLPGSYPRAALMVVVCVLAVGCTGRTRTPVSHQDRRPASVWPTHGWRVAAPPRRGWTPKGLAIVDDDAGRVYPSLRSVLVVRHGVPVLDVTSVPPVGSATATACSRGWHPSRST